MEKLNYQVPTKLSIKILYENDLHVYIYIFSFINLQGKVFDKSELMSLMKPAGPHGKGGATGGGGAGAGGPRMRPKAGGPGVGGPGARARPKTIHVDSGAVQMAEGMLLASRGKQGSSSNLTGNILLNILAVLASPIMHTFLLFKYTNNFCYNIFFTTIQKLKIYDLMKANLTTCCKRPEQSCFVFYLLCYKINYGIVSPLRNSPRILFKNYHIYYT